MSNHVEMENGTAKKQQGESDFVDLKNLPHLLKTLDLRPKVYDDILHYIGSTPLVKLNHIPKSEGIECDMYAKCEFMNPGGSVKDRIGYRMVLEAEKAGILKPGKSVIIEPTSGNTGIGLTLAAAIKGYRIVIVLPEKMSNEKVDTMRALGAEIVRTPDVPSESPESNINVADRLATEIPGGIVLNQYKNPCNPLAHYDGTGEEILWALNHDVDMVVMGTGTGGTASGVAHKVKERCQKCVIVGVDPYGSILAKPDHINASDVQFFEVEGLGYDFYPKVLDRDIIDTWVKTADKESLNMARRLIREEGLLCGGSSGSVMWGALQKAKSLKKGQKCVVVLPDGIRNYLTKFASDQWMEAREFMPVPERNKLWWWEEPVPEALAQATPCITPKTSCLEALGLLRETGAKLLAAVDSKRSIVGVFTADHTRRRLTNMSGNITDDMDKFLFKKYYKVDLAHKPTIGLVSRMLDISPYVVVIKTESPHIQTPVGVITSEDLLMYLAKEKRHLNGNSHN